MLPRLQLPYRLAQRALPTSFWAGKANVEELSSLVPPHLASHQQRSASSAAPLPSEKTYKLDFHDSQKAFGQSSTSELARAWLVFRLCGFKPFVQNSEKLLSVSRKLLGDKATYFLVRHTFFNHFCAGENRAEVQTRMERLKHNNIGAILDYAAEDVPASGAEDAKVHSNQGNGPVDDTQEAVARQYDYSSETQSDAHAESFLEAIKASSHMRTSPCAPSFASVKLTALGNPLLLERTSNAINVVRGLFHEFDESQDGYIDSNEFKQGIKRIFPAATEEEMKAMFKALDPEGLDRIDYVAWCQHMSLTDQPAMAARILKCLKEEADPKDKDWRVRLSDVILNSEEVRLLEALYNRLSMLAQAAADHQVKLLVDAEHTFYQPAINHLALELSRKYNNDPQQGAVVYNTYQAYLKGSQKCLAEDLERAKRQGYTLGAKLVRGAYVTLERKRAQEKGIESPIFDTIDGTHANYDACMKMLLGEVAQGRAELMVASHNQRSVELAVEEMGKLQLDPSSSPVAFGTLFGMADHITQVLGLAGFRAFKLVPYGRIDQTIPYLLRRATEVRCRHPRARRLMLCDVRASSNDILKACVNVSRVHAHSRRGY
ncbi:FAD-linked oxidoreductase-like protein [Dunaliella salina]|uniref:Proline dehydrogenase n=1 Tax=Dunaliella salina TaxID=3046 RepID=A0ABQ7H6W8_DUNSA|nr:FAD-linked oxidoreductase-like protein [Dunaliella salina]|eukprot:KAF5842605.1 FAD-linked oxidoreductase-like protein [Dunaliella salina]